MVKSVEVKAVVDHIHLFARDTQPLDHMVPDALADGDDALALTDYAAAKVGVVMAVSSDQKGHARHFSGGEVADPGGNSAVSVDHLDPPLFDEGTELRHQREHGEQVFSVDGKKDMVHSCLLQLLK